MMLKQIFALFLLIYFILGSICLPKGDLSQLVDLPKMYRHCKTTEHTDMNMLDFLTDHLLNFDCLVDDHAGQDEQRPHIPVSFHSMQWFLFFQVEFTEISLRSLIDISRKEIIHTLLILSSDFIACVFRPPIH